MNDPRIGIYSPPKRGLPFVVASFDEMGRLVESTAVKSKTEARTLLVQRFPVIRKRKLRQEKR